MAEVSFKRYQEMARDTAIYPNRKVTVVLDGTEVRPGLDYTCKGLCGEVGELMEHLKKAYRDDKGALPPGGEKRYLIFKEVGDILWYLSQICDELDMNLEAIALANIVKLQDRKERGVIKGSGDKR